VRRWLALGTEAASSVAGTALAGWWLSRYFHSRMILVVACLSGVVLATWRLLRAAKP